MAAAAVRASARPLAVVVAEAARGEDGKGLGCSHGSRLPPTTGGRSSPLRFPALPCAAAVTGGNLSAATRPPSHSGDRRGRGQPGGRDTNGRGVGCHPAPGKVEVRRGTVDLGTPCSQPGSSRGMLIDRHSKEK